MSKYLLGLTMMLTAGSVMAGTPSSAINLGSLPQVAYTLVTDDHGGGAVKGGGGERSGPSEHAGGEAGDDHGARGEAEPGDDHGGNGELEAGDDKGVHELAEVGDDRGVDFNDLPDDSLLRKKELFSNK